MQDTDTAPASDTSIAIPQFDSSTPGEDIIKALKELEAGDSAFESARNEFFARAQKFSLDDVAVDLFTSEPFYGALSRRINKVRSARIPTAAVTVLNDMFVMLWNASFMTRISPDAHLGARHRLKAKGVCIHEFLHLALEHPMSRSRGMQHPMLANWAFDLAINCMIKRELLPDGLLIPGEALTVPEDSEGVYRPEDLAQYKKLSNFIKDLPPKQASEWYYSALLEYIEKNSPEMLQNKNWGAPMDQAQGQDSGECPQCHGSGKIPGQGQDPGQGDGQDPGQGGGQDPGQGGGHNHGQQDQTCPSCNGSGKGVPQSVKNGYGKLGNFDSHDGWENVSDEEREFIRQRVKSILRDATNEADNHSSPHGWGSVPAELQQLIRKLISDQIDWRALLRQFVGFMQHLNKSSTIKRINSRYPYIHPGKRRARGATLHIYIDQSGSVSDKAISLLFGELDGLSKFVNFKVYFFDTEVDEDFIDWKRGQKHPAQRHRMGGTDFDAVTRHADKHAGQMDGILICTDGECSKPGPCRVKRAWAIVPDSKLMFETDELVIQMTNDNDKKKPTGGK